MMWGWAGPLAIGLIAGLVGWHAALVAIPRVVMKIATDRVAEAGGINRFAHAPLVTDKARRIVRPSPDLAYSSCPLDLKEGPLLIEVAPVAAPYWSLSIFDRRTDVAFVRNNRDTKGAPIRIAVAGEGQRVPDGIETVRVPGARGIALIRILLEDRARFPVIDVERRRSRCTPLSAGRS